MLNTYLSEEMSKLDVLIRKYVGKTNVGEKTFDGFHLRGFY